jgi:O-antigen/teichoic acid export membrane protein
MSRIAQEWERIRKSSLARNAGWMMFGQCMGYVLQAAYFVILARLLGVVQYGIFAGAFAFVNLVGRYSTLGTGTLFLRYVSVDRNKFAVFFGNILLVTAVFGTISVFILHIAGIHLLNPASAGLVVLAAIANLLGTQFGICAAQIFQAVEQMRLTAVLSLFMNFLRVLVAGAMLLMMRHASALQWSIAAMLVSILGAIIALSLVAIKLGRPSLSIAVFRQHLVEGLEFAFASSTTSAYNDLDKTMLSHYGMNAANGIYTMAYRVIDIATMPIVSLRDAAMPRIFKAGTEGIGKAGEYAGRIWKQAFLFGVVVCIGLFLVAPLIPHVVGKSFVDSVSALRWLCLIPVFRSIHEIAGSALTGAGMQRYRTGTQVLATLLNLCLNLWLIPRHGWQGAAWASLVTDGSLGLMNWSALKFLTLKESRR